MRKLHPLLPAGLVLSAIGIGTVVIIGQPKPAQPLKAKTPIEVANGSYASAPKEAAKQYVEIVEKLESSPDPKDQDTVGEARIRLGYLASKTQDYSEARGHFQKAAEIKGTGKMGADFGGVNDQAAYQAIVCLAAEGKTEEAKKEFRSFMTEYKLSPLVHAVYKRLMKMGGNKPDPELEALLEGAVVAQQRHIQFETSVCGPKAIVYFMEKLGKSSPDYKDLAELCGTSDRGTTIEGMRKGLKGLGVETFAFQVNRKDFERIELPAIWLIEDHYVVLLGFGTNTARVYDPRYTAEKEVPLPHSSHPDFLAPVLTLSIPATE